MFQSDQETIKTLDAKTLNNILEKSGKLRNYQDYKDRFRSEYFDLFVRYEKLRRLLEDYKDNKLTFKPVCSYETLYIQSYIMREYLICLVARAEIEEINVDINSML